MCLAAFYFVESSVALNKFLLNYKSYIYFLKYVYNAAWKSATKILGGTI